MQALSDRTASFTDSVIRRMTRISNQYGAVNLSQGFPDFDPPKPILDRLSQVAYEDYHQYSITWGAQDFREALAKKQSHFMGRDIDPNGEIVVTCGSTEAMMAAMMTVANPGDKVVIFSPFYENYSADTILSGAVPIYVPLTPPSFTFDPEVLEDAFRQHPKALVLCNPSNPCGKVFTREELEIIAGLAKKYDVYVITDEVYEHIIYAPHQHTYFATLPDMWERTLSCSSLSKTYSITGWRLGYIIAPPEIIDRAKKVHDFLTVGAAAPLQEAIIPGLNFGQDYYDALQAEYGCVFLSGFLKSTKGVYSFTLQYWDQLWRIGSSTMLRSVEYALIVSIAGTVFAMLFAYYMDRRRILGRSLFDCLATLPYMLPGTCFGIGYILAFNHAPLKLTGTALIVLANMLFKQLPTSTKICTASLALLPEVQERSARDLGAGRLAVLRDVVFPALRPAFLSCFVYNFTSSMTTAGSIIFLIDAKRQLAVFKLFDAVYQGDYALASLIASVITVIVLLVEGLAFLITRKGENRRVSRT